MFDDLHFRGLSPTWTGVKPVVDVCFPIVADETATAALKRASARDLMRVLVVFAIEAAPRSATLGRVRALVDIEIEHPRLVLSLLCRHHYDEVRKATAFALGRRGCHFHDPLLVLNATLTHRHAEYWRQDWPLRGR